MENYNICSKCFLDPSISQHIDIEGIEGSCCLCNSKRNKVLDILSIDLSPFFDNIFYNDESIDNSNLKNENDLLELLRIFDLIKINENKKYIIKYYIDNKYPNLYNSFIIQSSEILKRLQFDIWEKLQEEIKHERRFLFKESTLKLLSEMQRYSFIFLETLKENSFLYRGRVGNYYNNNDFLTPPKDKAQHLRANSYGIPHLYLTNNKDCCINECRLSYPNGISIATFSLKKELNLLNLTKKPSIIEMCRIADGMEPENLFKILEVFLHMYEEMSKPVYDDKKHLDYILTQLFTECFKFAHESIKEKETQPIDGIIFRSSFDFNDNKNWKNYVIFDGDNILDCINIEHYSWVYENKLHKLELFNTYINIE